MPIQPETLEEFVKHEMRPFFPEERREEFYRKILDSMGKFYALRGGETMQALFIEERRRCGFLWFKLMRYPAWYSEMLEYVRKKVRAVLEDYKRELEEAREMQEWVEKPLDERLWEIRQQLKGIESDVNRLKRNNAGRP